MKKMIKVLPIFLLLGILVITLPLPGSAAIDPPGGGGVITNPLGSDSISALLINLTRWLLGLVGVLALLSLTVGGIRMIAGMGNEAQVAKAKTTILWAVIGLIVVFLAFAILTTVQRLLGVQ